MLSFQYNHGIIVPWYNWYCSKNVAASIKILFHGNWCSEVHWKKVRRQKWITVNFNVRKNDQYRWNNGWLQVFCRNNYTSLKEGITRTIHVVSTWNTRDVLIAWLIDCYSFSDRSRCPSSKNRWLPFKKIGCLK